MQSGLQLSAQQPFYRNYTVEDGLISSTVYSMHQDKLGFLWFCTESGVSKFDGVLFRNFGRQEGLGDNEIFHTFEDSKGRMWFFPFNGRLSYYSNGIIYNGKSDKLLDSLEITSVFTFPFEDVEGRLWIGTTKDKAIAYYSDSVSLLIDARHRNIQVDSVSESHITYHTRNKQFVYTLLWANGSPLLGELKEERDFVVTNPPKPTVEGYEVSDYLVDKESNQWYTTLGSGVLMRSRSYVNYLDKDNGLDNENVYSIANLLDSSLLTGFHDGTLQMWSKTQSIKTVLGKSLYNRILDIHLDKHLWVASDRGLYVLDRKDLHVLHHFAGSIKCLTQFGRSLYFGTSSGAFKVSLDNPTDSEKFFNQRTISMNVLNESFIYLGTNKGLMVYRNGKIEDWSNKHQLLSGRVKAMSKLGDNAILMGTHGEGVLVIADTNFYLINMEKGLSSNICQAVYKENDSTVWFGTNNGLNKLKFIGKQYGSPIIDVYKISDGLRSNFINDIYVANNQVFVASDKGVSFFSLQNYRASSRPVAYVYQISINDKDTVLADNYTLAHDQNKLDIYYSGIAFESGKNTKFQYRILGIDSNWKTTSLRQLSFQAIPPGKYRFELKAVATDGSKSDEATGFNFHIKHPFWKTTWFILLAITVGLLLTWRINKFIINYNRRKDFELRNKELKSKNIEIEKERQHSEDLLLNILPHDTAEELKQFGEVKAKKLEHATVLFSDFEGFTKLSAQVSPEELVHELDHCFKAYDRIIDKYHIEKVKTIGDAYMCAAGLNQDTTDDPKQVIKAALEIMDFMETYQRERESQNKPFFRVRIGVHSGKVVSGVVGLKKFAFDIWGDTVNTAARMESNGEVGKLNISEDTYHLIKDEFECVSRGKVEVKGKGALEMFFVEGKI